MALPVFISSFTLNTPYQEAAKYLEASLKKFKLDYEIEPFKSLGSWRKNSNFTAWQCQKMLIKYFPRPILRLDADAVLFKYPSLLETLSCDISACIWTKYRKELLGGTIYLNNNTITNDLVDLWVSKCKKTPDRRNPDLLYEAIQTFKRIKFSKLPLGYCFIFDLMRNEVKKENRYIVHFQGSRNYKDIINGVKNNIAEQTKAFDLKVGGYNINGK